MSTEGQVLIYKGVYDRKRLPCHVGYRLRTTLKFTNDADLHLKRDASFEPREHAILARRSEVKDGRARGRSCRAQPIQRHALSSERFRRP